MEAIQGFVNAAAATSHDACRVATPRDAVLNSECCYTFHSPYRYSKSGSGIFVSLTTFVGTTPSLCMIFRDPSEQGLFLRIVKERTLQEEPPMGGTQETEAPPTITAVLPTKLAIGVEGGFLGSDDDRYETIATYSVVLVQNTTNDNTDDPPPAILAEVPYTDETKATFPVEIQRSVDTVVNHVGVAIQQDVQAWQANDDDDGAIGVSKYCADLIYVDNGVAIDPNPDSWKCGLTGATTNLWLNLSDGYIGGGRKNWDVSGCWRWCSLLARSFLNRCTAFWFKFLFHKNRLTQ